jgi:hypothetical protein
MGTAMSSQICTPPEGCWVPNIKSCISGSAQELEQKLKVAGIKLRRQLLLNAHNDLKAWSLLYSPPSIHEASHTLAEMLLNIPLRIEITSRLWAKHPSARL